MPREMRQAQEYRGCSRKADVALELSPQLPGQHESADERAILPQHVEAFAEQIGINGWKATLKHLAALVNRAIRQQPIQLFARNLMTQPGPSEHQQKLENGGML